MLDQCFLNLNFRENCHNTVKKIRYQELVKAPDGLLICITRIQQNQQKYEKNDEVTIDERPIKLGGDISVLTASGVAANYKLVAATQYFGARHEGHIGELVYESFVLKILLVKYQSQSEMIKVYVSQF